MRAPTRLNSSAHNHECQKAFDTIKAYLIQPPILVPPVPSRPLVLYLTVRRQSLGCMLGQEDESTRTEREIYYLSKKFIEGESNYPEIEKMCCALVWVMQRLRQYTLYHTIRLLSKADPLRYLLDSPSSMRNIAKWRCQLTEYDIEYVPRTSVKGQAIADHLAEFPVDGDTPINTDFSDEGILQVDGEKEEPTWKMYFDGAVNSVGFGVGAVLISPDGRHYPIAAKVDFSCTNNTKDVKLVPYHEYLEELEKNFEKISFTYTPRAKNQFADTLATLASMASISEGNVVEPLEIEVTRRPAHCNAIESSQAKPWLKTSSRRPRQKLGNEWHDLKSSKGESRQKESINHFLARSKTSSRRPRQKLEDPRGAVSPEHGEPQQKVRSGTPRDAPRRRIRVCLMRQTVLLRHRKWSGNAPRHLGPSWSHSGPSRSLRSIPATFGSAPVIQVHPGPIQLLLIIQDLFGSTPVIQVYPGSCIRVYPGHSGLSWFMHSGLSRSFRSVLVHAFGSIPVIQVCPGSCIRVYPGHSGLSWFMHSGLSRSFRSVLVHAFGSIPVIQVYPGSCIRSIPVIQVYLGSCIGVYPGHSGLGTFGSAHGHLDPSLRSPTSPTLHRAVTGASVPNHFPETATATPSPGSLTRNVLSESCDSHGHFPDSFPRALRLGNAHLQLREARTFDFCLYEVSVRFKGANA
ncbi:hypothetical protein CRG98_015080 [Punica granatum]|uniref:Reverse transcriptase RNase H-like domain-containing protein n=1 Tax=Punica granatum TaxID=22663 RepID=A0A2I0K7J4_PUNGR|nr:hypothetical protein CRG98_015080 [Punica granatum]